MKASRPGQPPVKKNSIEENGSLLKVYPEQGLCLETWNNAGNQFFQLNSSADQNPRCCLHIFYLLTTGNIRIVNKKIVPGIKAGCNENNTIFTTNKDSLVFEIYPATPFRALLLRLESGWLQKELNKTGDSSSNFMDQLLRRQSVSGNCSPNEFLLANKLFEHISGNKTDRMFLLSRTLLLVSDFFERSFNHKSAGVPVAYYQKMLVAENIIASSIKIKLPPLEEIAGRTAMSESGLKRYFQKVFGKNIYEYYIDAKMDTAKRMLVEKNLSVAEVSEFLGYEKPKHFINNFKKHFSFSPGDIRKTSYNTI